MDPNVKIWPVERTNKDGLWEGAWYIHVEHLPFSSRKSIHCLNTVGSSSWSVPRTLRCMATSRGAPNTAESEKRETHTRISYVDYVRVHICYSGFKNPVDKGSRQKKAG